MARCSFFSLDVSWFDDDWYLDVPDKYKCPMAFLDIVLNGMCMRTYDIPTYKGAKKSAQELEELKETIKLPELPKRLKFRTISEITGWKKPKILFFIDKLNEYQVINFSVLENNQVLITHRKALKRLHETQKGYFRRLGISLDTFQTKHIRTSLPKEKEIINREESFQEDSPPVVVNITKKSKSDIEIENRERGLRAIGKSEKHIQEEIRKMKLADDDVPF
tara:strand:+ start:497 stop:1159 length:663 start_codon:yes stop_codon:yes gene_type:complete